ncbi:MAG TPA: DUF4185 domain-containing protein [Verrucomicrobiae bacterium]|jgi:hypothetical protein|nr:DUF4185 domain-containing protein [Verrucomicrobiae bacterium]
MRVLLICLGLLGILARASAAPDLELDALFQRTNGWIGADGDYSVQLNSDTTLWLFGDTLIGDVRDGKRVHATMINNSVALMPTGGRPQYFYRTNSSGAPASVFTPADDTNSFYWPWDGVRTDRGLYLFFMQVRHTAENSVWGFKVFGDALAFVENPDSPPQDWKITWRKVPFKSFGWAVVRDGEFVYVYGSNRKSHHALVARAPQNVLDDFGQWRFYDHGQWDETPDHATAVISEAPPEGSVKWIAGLRRFVAVYSPDIWGDVVMRTAQSPVGPWENRRVIYRCTEANSSNALYCYAGKLHPELSQSGELVISYAVNSNHFSDLFKDADIYWPRFVRLNY